MFKALDTPGDEYPLNQVIVDKKMIQNKQVENFVSQSTCRIFEITGFLSAFMVKRWKDGTKINYD